MKNPEPVAAGLPRSSFATTVTTDGDTVRSSSAKEWSERLPPALRRVANPAAGVVAPACLDHYRLFGNRDNRLGLRVLIATRQGRQTDDQSDNRNRAAANRCPYDRMHAAGVCDAASGPSPTPTRSRARQFVQARRAPTASSLTVIRWLHFVH